MIARRSAGLVRWWVEQYTRGLSADLRDVRRGEIEADVWDQLTEASLGGRTDRSTAVELLIRLVLGVPADIGWRFAQGVGLRADGQRREPQAGTGLWPRLAGWAAVVGGGLWALFFVIAGLSHANRADYGPAWIPVVLLAGPALLAALTGLSVSQFRDHPRSIWIAFLLPAAGIGIVLVGLATVLPTAGLTASEGSLAARVIYGGLSLLLIGSVVFVAVTVSPAAFSRVATGAVVVGVATAIPPLFGMLTGAWLAVGGVAFGLGWIGLGIDAVRRGRQPIAPASAGA